MNLDLYDRQYPPCGECVHFEADEGTCNLTGETVAADDDRDCWERR